MGHMQFREIQAASSSRAETSKLSSSSQDRTRHTSSARGSIQARSCVLRKGEITIHNSVSQSASLAGFSSDAHIVVETFFLRSRQDTSQIQIQGSSRFGVSAVRAAK